MSSNLPRIFQTGGRSCNNPPGKKKNNDNDRTASNHQEVPPTAFPTSSRPHLQRSYDYLFKVLVCGDSGVGKTALIQRYCQRTYTSDFVSTIGIDFKIKMVTCRGRIIKLQIWDPAGQERFNQITRVYFRGANAIMYAYDVTRRESFEHIRSWIGKVEDELGPTYSTVPKMLVGNKVDAESQRQVTYQQGEEIAFFLKMRYKETSVLHQDTVDDAFNVLVHDLVTQKDYEIQHGILTIENGNNSGFKLSKKEEKKSVSCSQKIRSCT